jgi:hypothetical protein
VNEIVWNVTEREFTTWFEATCDGFELWLEWNDRVGAYRFGFTAPDGTNAPSSLGFATDEDEAKAVLLEAVARFQGSS